MLPKPPPRATPLSPEARLLWLERELSFGRWIHGAAARDWVVSLLVAVSRIADGWIWYGAVAVLPLVGGPQGTSVSIRLVAVGVFDLATYVILKRWVARPRPYAACSDIRACTKALDQYSFPSGHTLHAVACSVVLTAYYPHLAWVVWPFAGLVALSRLVLGLHYLSDVIAGAALGALVAEVSFQFF